ncbi:MAG: hypothetical protein EOO50_01130 [Flavobacterium sp.]|uniref:hypothetical protein n=1 Tax=Flavobacterium sp. TaxID=239 RepID=UPI001213E215|nr:hypothetical protein [Flavobacterium sp.]RZJ68423.1 MAG: hypothetical protein EOO50_01130 [Flavobacterium sp.]
MPLSTSLKNEENERINNILKQLVALAFLPEPNYDELLGQLALTSSDLETFSSYDLIAHLAKLHFDFTNAETFADFLASVGQKQKAIELYEYIQLESQTFSFAIMNKVNGLR